MSQIKPRVVVVDDEAVLAEELCKVFSKSGYDAAAAFDVESAIALVRAKKPHLIVSDNRMPDGNLSDLLRKLGRKECQEIPVLFCMSGYSENHLPEDVLNRIDRFFEKPFKTSEILDAASTYIARINLRTLKNEATAG